MSLLVLGGVGCLDYTTGYEISMGFLYLVPIALAARTKRIVWGLAICLGAAVIRLGIDRMNPAPWTVTAWNTGSRLAIHLTFWALCVAVARHGVALPVAATLRRHGRMALLPLAIVVLAGGGWMWYRGLPAGGASGREASTSLAEIARSVRACVQGSRPVLLGSRDPRGPSCVQIIRAGQVGETLPPDMADLDGGPGTRFALLTMGSPRAADARGDFGWHQGRLRPFLQNLLASNEAPQREAVELARKTLAFCEQVSAWKNWPEDMTPAEIVAGEDWLSFCLASVNQAVARRDLRGVQRWAAELASAAFALADLHRWLGFLAENHLTALEFQAQCESLFTWASPMLPSYDLRGHISSFPAGLLTLHGVTSYAEVERQAERAFHTPPDRLAEMAANQHYTSASVWMPPGVRKIFVDLGAGLSPANRRTWEQAARTPYEHSYLVNMLYRASRGEAIEPLETVLKRFNERRPEATMAELMGVLMYRGHSFGGIEWADRYRPEMMAEAAQVSGSDVEALEAAHKYVHGFYRLAEYTGTPTLRQALERKRLDCVRATDMMVNILRNSGIGRLGHVRWTAGTAAHSVAALFLYDGNRIRTLVSDGMVPSDQPEEWPDAYLQGHAWPAGLESNPPPYAVELYVRGLDNYVWAEGYILRDRNAGTLMKAAIPYLPLREQRSTRRLSSAPGEAGPK